MMEGPCASQTLRGQEVQNCCLSPPSSPAPALPSLPPFPPLVAAAIGHWWEMLGPLYSILKTSGFKRPCDQFVLLHLQRKHVMEWVSHATATDAAAAAVFTAFTAGPVRLLLKSQR